MVVTDPDRAATIARQIADHRLRGFALAYVARAVSTANPQLAARHTADVESALMAIMDRGDQATLLADATCALAESCPQLLAQLARNFEAHVRAPEPPSSPSSRTAWLDRMSARADPASALSSIASALAPTDPDGAEAIARSVENPHQQAIALVHIACALAPHSPEEPRPWPAQ
jgi:hypothetical protein